MNRMKLSIALVWSVVVGSSLMGMGCHTTEKKTVVVHDPPRREVIVEHHDHH